MKLSKHLGRTIKEVPANAQTASHKLMLRAGYIKQLSAGVYTYMPLLLRTINKISKIVREELDKAGAQELLMPALQPAELWKESKRWERYTDIDGIMFAFKDRRQTECCLGPTHEEVITDVVRNEVSSYKDLPKNLYQIQTKFRDEIRPRFGLMRAREFIMKDAYSFDVDQAGLDLSYQSMHVAYTNIFTRLGAEFKCVEADAGAIGGSGGSQEFMVLAESGEDVVIYCDNCDYAANRERAESRLTEYEQDLEPKPMERVLGKGIIGVEELSKFLQIPVWKTTKTLLFRADQQLVAVMVRGDCEVNEIKVCNYLGCQELKLIDPEKIEELTGASVGYAGPIGLSDRFKIIADSYVNNRINFECGANATDYHNINVNFERDLESPEFGDFKMAKAGDHCCRCKSGVLQERRGIEVGHIFKLGTKYAKELGCTYLNQSGESKPVEMGCYGIGVSRVAAAIIEQNHDQYGIIWPIQVAPYHVHLVGLNLENENLRPQVDQIYQTLLSAGLEVLYDDRLIRAGEKFNDADLIGIPVRITVSEKTLSQNLVEFKLRKDNKTQSRLLKIDEAIDTIFDLQK